MTPAHYDIMRVAHNNTAFTCAYLRSIFGASDTSMRGFMKKLMRDNYIVKTGRKEMGQFVFEITDHGRKTFMAMDPPSKPHQWPKDIQKKVPDASVAGPRYAPKYEPYVPPPWNATRPGADDHRQYKSKGM